MGRVREEAMVEEVGQRADSDFRDPENIHKRVRDGLKNADPPQGLNHVV